MVFSNKTTCFDVTAFQSIVSFALNLQSQARKQHRVYEGNDLWAGDGGVDNLAVVNEDDTFSRTKDPDSDSLFVAAKLHGESTVSCDQLQLCELFRWLARYLEAYLLVWT